MTTPPPLPIDLDAEAIQFEGHWYTRDELARKIKGMLDAGDFAVGKPSQALEQLTQTINGLRTLAFRVTPEVADAINAISAKHGRAVGSIIREALAMHLGLPIIPEAERPSPKRTTAPTGRRQTEPEMQATTPLAPVVAPPVSPPIIAPPVPADLKATQQMAAPPPQVIAGPGALKAAMPPPPPGAAGAPTVILEKSLIPEGDASVPPNMTTKKSDDESIERRWFGDGR